MAHAQGVDGVGGSAGFDYQADYDAMAAAAKQLRENYAIRLDEIIQAVYAKKEEILADGWIGDDSKEYIQRLDEYLPSVQKLRDTLDAFGEKIEIFVYELQNTQGNIKTAVDNTLYG